MPPPAKRFALTLCGALATASVLLAAGPGGIALASSRSAPQGINAVALAQTDADLKVVVDWWTPDRLKRANSYTNKPEAPGSGTSRGTTTSAPAASAATASPSATASPTAKATTTAPAATATSTAPKKPKDKPDAIAGVRPPRTADQILNSKNVNFPPTAGRVFFRNGDAEYWCSATAVHSKYGNVVATAGHCAYDVKNGKPFQYWIFIPSYAGDGKTPYGIYAGHTLYLNDKYTATGDFDYDYAFVTVHHGYRYDIDKDAKGDDKKDPKGQLMYKKVDTGRLETQVGGQGFAWNRGFTVAAYAFGYPAGPNNDGSRPFNGQTMEYCLTRATSKISAPKWELASGVLFRGCGFTAGASGGPWLIKYSNTRRIGYLNGITSLTYDLNGDSRNDAVSSPYFNSATYVVYSYAAGQKTD